ncbi:hypothetical protein PV10_03563 [Exophiala mesophila]|uniref:Cytochrome P450 n=1 Tax=Exophiala mesophila TaxID=212818 RepID=A0A0D1ZMZ7_EXOME|nr:uncharacterized protein PV10_03563 [Exophiala mesophila]KIV95977.1 hypothetical protein PV10_03563 [Exophiala mesophila]
MAILEYLQPTWQLAVVGLLSYILWTVVYRRFFHPLAHIPGPFLPAVTMLYQSFYNGRYYLEIARMHEKYGPVVRITPEEIHLSDADNYDKIYYVGSKFYKSPNLYNALCIPLSTFGCVSNETHRIRRGAMNPMFSRKMVLELEQVVQDKANKVCKITQKGIDAGQPIDLHHAFRSVSVDVISDYAFDSSYDLLDKEDIGAYFFRMVRGLGPAFYTFQQIPLAQKIALSTPPWLAPYLSEPLGCVTGFQQDCAKQAQAVKLKMEQGKLGHRQTIFSTLLSLEDKPAGYEVPDNEMLMQQAYSVLAAAADTTGNAMTVAAYHILKNPSIYQSLVKELQAAFPDPSSQLEFVELEKLPYLTAVIKEALRLSFGVPGRVPRVTPDPGASFNGYAVPGGTIVGMSSWLMHRNPEIFPDPMKFDPSRWLDADNYRRLDHHMVPFGRGSRQCVGMPLAYCELYVTLGTFFHRFPKGLQVYKTTDYDMEYVDFFSSYHIEGRNWFKAIGTDIKDVAL